MKCENKDCNKKIKKDEETYFDNKLLCKVCFIFERYSDSEVKIKNKLKAYYKRDNQKVEKALTKHREILLKHEKVAYRYLKTQKRTIQRKNTIEIIKNKLSKKIRKIGLKKAEALFLIIFGLIFLPTPFFPGSIMMMLGISKLWGANKNG